MLKNLSETYELIESRTIADKDAVNVQNRFTTKPQGILLQDSYNNPFFPITPKPNIDTNKFNTGEIFKRFRELYSDTKSMYLPWHYCVEFINNQYYAFNTRPLNLKFPIRSLKAIKNKKSRNIKWDGPTELFFKEKIFDITESIHICLVGNSNIDIYTNKMYQLIGEVCMLPILKQYKLPGSLYQRVFPLNTGSRFKFELISKFIK